MPIYEYRCDDCDQVFEAIQRISDAPLDVCRLCGGAARRIVSSPAIQFLGSGWYVTDYARKNGDKAAGGKNGSAAKGGPEKSDSGKPQGKEGSGAKPATASSGKTSSSSSESRAR
ncbi:MAG: hypothetical protein OXI45_05555 [Acidobacteriota bacterium]|nr:hypothetical protein [Acidobacteriota bacterium]MDE2711649.1 hypothetical protein [Acidobacteriota bacterium]MXW72337.1 hypothetical protein [Acidobacteriota bacterium]MXX85081.1 hypothetical protein [Acidobacteriota bacterium]MYE43510.1 hypothetical protein [Acidobacteriota bacterium]